MSARDLTEGSISPWVVVVLIILGLMAGSIFFVRAQLRDELRAAENSAERELQLLATSIRNELRRGNYQDTFDTLKAWGEAHADIVSLHLIAENGFVISEYDRLAPADHTLFLETSITYSYARHASLTLRTDLARLARSKNMLIVQVGLAVAVIAAVLVVLTHLLLLHRREAARLRQLAAERERTNAALREEMQQRRTAERERDRLTTMFEQTSDVASIADPEGRVVYVNRAGRRAVGLSDDAPVAMHFSAFQPEWAAELCMQQGIPVAIRDGVWSGEAALLNHEGREVPVSQVILSHKDEQGKLLYLSTIMHDISERKQMEEILRARTVQLQSIIANAPVMIWSCDRQGQFTLSEGRGLDRFGVKPGEVVGQSVFEVGKDLPDFLAAVRRALNGEELVAYHHVANRFLEVHYTPLRNAAGQIQGIIGVTVDTTERHEAEEKLRASEASLREKEHLLAEAQEIAHLGNWNTDLTTGESRWSDEAYRLLGLEPGSVKAGFDLYVQSIHPQDRDAVLAAIKRAMDPVAQAPYRIEYRIMTPTGERYVEERGRADFDAAGKAVRLFGTTLDITVRKQAEMELERHRKHLEELVEERTAALRAANAELSAFSYSVSHDLRAPLRAIHGFSKILLDDYASKLDAEGRSHLGRVCSAAERMGGLIDDLLELSIVGRSELRVESVDMTALAHDIAEQLRASEPHRVVEVSIQAGLTAQADAGLMRLVLQNLLGNAWKYTRHAGRAHIELTQRFDEREVVFRLRDNGVGFDMAHADKLFHPFQRLHRSSEFEGTGVGLAIVARILVRHGGRAWAESAPGQGATFYFALPWAKQS